MSAHGHHRGSAFCSRAFRDADRRHHAGEILFRRSALCAGGAADARAGDATADAQPDASAARQAVHRAVDPFVRRRAAGLALSGRTVRIARHRRGVSVRPGAVRGARAGDCSEPARLFQPDAVRAIADRDAGYFRAHLQPVRDRGVHAWLSKTAAASVVRACRDRLRPVDRLQMERAVRARGLHRHRRRDPPDAKLAHAIRRRPARRLVPARSLARLQVVAFRDLLRAHSGRRLSRDVHSALRFFGSRIFCKRNGGSSATTPRPRSRATPI